LTTVFVCLDEGNIVAGVRECAKILVVDVDEKRAVDEIRVSGMREIEDIATYFDTYDPYVFFTSSIDEDTQLAIEEYGVHVYVTKRVELNTLLEEIYGFSV